LLNGLTPLIPDPDYEDIEAMRSIVRDELTQLVGEFGQVAGPRVQRVDSIFKLLIGPKAHYHNPVAVQGHLGQLGERLGMKRRFVNSIEDEQDLTNFLILVDYTNSLFQTWVAQRDFFSRGKHGQPFLGTQLVLISQALASIADQVQDAYDALDSVYIGAAERQTTLLNFFGEFAPITLAELLGWVLDFSSNEGPQLLQESGKDGVVAFRSTINRLQYLLFLTLQLARSGGNNPARGFHTYRVQVALADVCQSLRLVDRESDKIRRNAVDDDPALTAEGAIFSLESLVNVTPTATGTTYLTVGGRNITPGSRMLLIATQKPTQGYQGTAPAENDLAVWAKNVYTAQQQTTIVEGVTSDGNFITAAFILPTSLTQNYTLAVITPDGAYAWLDQAITPAELQPPLTLQLPQIDSVTVKKTLIDARAVYQMRIKGSNFEPDAICTISATTSTPLNVQFNPNLTSANELEVLFPDDGTGKYSIPNIISASPARRTALTAGITYLVMVTNPATAKTTATVNFVLS
jgi:hypothetical protein